MRNKKRRLNLRRGPVDLVRQDDVGEDRSLLYAELAVALIEDGGPDDIGRKQVRRELDPPEVRVEGLGEGSHHERLGEARQALQKNVATRQQGYEQPLHGLVLTDDPLVDGLRDLGEQRGAGGRGDLLHEGLLNER